VDSAVFGSQVRVRRHWRMLLHSGAAATCRPLVDRLRVLVNAAEADVKPIFGICMGNQLLGMAAGCDTYKLPFGNRGQNQPVINNLTQHAFITAQVSSCFFYVGYCFSDSSCLSTLLQNHGFAIDTARLPSNWKALFTNVNDKTNEGIIHTSRPFFTAQFHPEAKSGPNDTAFLFDMFMETIRSKVWPSPKEFWSVVPMQ
jgi:carbamoyl-phosphate synthase (ammonia)